MFPNLGFLVSSDAMIDKVVDNQLTKMNSAFSRLYKYVFNQQHQKEH